MLDKPKNSISDEGEAGTGFKGWGTIYCFSTTSCATKSPATSSPASSRRVPCSRRRSTRPCSSSSTGVTPIQLQAVWPPTKKSCGTSWSKSASPSEGPFVTTFSSAEMRRAAQKLNFSGVTNFAKFLWFLGATIIYNIYGATNLLARKLKLKEGSV